MDSLAKTLVVVGLALAALGALLWLFGRSGATLLPGDIVIEKKNVRIVFPVVTCLVLSLVFSVVAWFFRR